MKDLLYLSWFYKDEQFHKDMHQFVETQAVSTRLKLLFSQHKEAILKGQALCDQNGAKAVTFIDKDYPDSFKSLMRPPWVLTYKGDLNLLSAADKVSIVGSRRADPEALYWLNKNLENLPNETVLVSGGAIGVDQEVHKIAYRVGCKTICVLPVGICRVYPTSLSKLFNLFNKLSEKGRFLALSQFYPNQTVFKSSFYPRNYVLAAISKKLIVVQSEKRSGTMVTAKYALENGLEIYTLPASPWDLRYSGNLKLLEDGAHQLIDLSFIQ